MRRGEDEVRRRIDGPWRIMGPDRSMHLGTGVLDIETTDGRGVFGYAAYHFFVLTGLFVGWKYYMGWARILHLFEGRSTLMNVIVGTWE